MSESFIGEIRMFAGNFAPEGWTFCDGSLLSIAENDALFALLGTTYGGDGQVTFALPDLRGRVPIHMGQGSSLSQRSLGEMGGAENVTLLVSQIPAHNHTAVADGATGTQANPQSNVWATSGLGQFSNNPANATMSPSAIGVTGGNQPHENMAPYQAINFIISLYGIFPSQS